MDELEIGAESAAEVEETEEATTSTEEVAQEETGEPTAAPPKPKGVQKRLDELTREKHEERRRADHLASMLEQALAAQKQPERQPEPPAPIPATRPKPTLADCDFDTEKYADELTDWKLEQRDAQSSRQQEEYQRTRQQETFAQTFEEKRIATLEQGQAKFADFTDVLTSFAPGVMHMNLAAAVLETAAPADVTYYLGKNPTEAARISKLDPFRMALELGRIESKAVVAVPPKKPTSAPPPVSPVGSNAPAGTEPDPAKDPQGWLAWERARVKALGRRY